MNYRNRLLAAVLAFSVGGAATELCAAEVEFFDDGPLAGQGYPFSESVRAGDLLFLAGQIGEKDGELVKGGIEAEARQTLTNIRAALGRRGLGLENVVKCTVFLADISEWGAFNNVYKEFFNPPYPARSALGVNGLALNARAEVECIAAY
jgi:2-iminobutanoate/2-iminopropanoate deaminase